MTRSRSTPGFSDPYIGTEIAGYRVEAFVGAGGMGVVYRAADLRLERSIALKLLAASFAEDPGYRRRFLDESRRAAAIEHPHIVPVYDAGEESGVLFIAMRYVDGDDLACLLEQQGALEPGRALALLSPIADALDAAHGRGLVHRDVKPSNILVSRDVTGAERAYLTDFGIARRFAGGERDTHTGHVLGTADYVAPEQIEGRDVDGCADLYSLGCVLFECLSGEPPFSRETAVATLVAHTRAAVPRASERRRELPSAIDEVIERALAKKPAERFDSCGDMLDAAHAALGMGAGDRGERSRTRPRALDDHCRAVVEAMLRGRVVPVIGATANTLARREQGEGPPDTETLSTRLSELFAYPASDAPQLPRVSQYAAVMRGDGPLQDELHDLLDADYEPGSVHHLMAALPALLRARGAPCPLVLTTNYDGVLERAFHEANEHVNVVSYIASGRNRGKFWHRAPDGSTTLVDLPNTYAPLSLEERSVILKLHGQVDRSPEREHESFVVTEDDYIGYLARTEMVSAVPVGLAARLRRSHFLFLGHDPRDWSSRVIFDRLWGDRPLAYRCWAVVSGHDPLEDEFWRYRDVDVVRAPLAEYVMALAAHARTLAVRPE